MFANVGESKMSLDGLEARISPFEETGYWR